MLENPRIDVTLLLYGPPNVMHALHIEEKMRMSNGERSPLEAFTRQESAYGRQVSFMVATSVENWDRHDPWVQSFYRLMTRLRLREDKIRNSSKKVLSDMVSYEFACVPTIDLSSPNSAFSLKDLIETSRTFNHDGALSVRLHITN